MKVYVIEHDGVKSCCCNKSDAIDMQDEGAEIDIKEIEMSKEEFEDLPEFQGF